MTKYHILRMFHIYLKFMKTNCQNQRLKEKVYSYLCSATLFKEQCMKNQKSHTQTSLSLHKQQNMNYQKWNYHGKNQTRSFRRIHRKSRKSGRMYMERDTLYAYPPCQHDQSTHRKATGTTQQISGSTQLSQNNHSFSTHRIPGICGKADCFQCRHVLCDEKCLGRQWAGISNWL